jgi:hypothetical protein
MISRPKLLPCLAPFLLNINDWYADKPGIRNKERATNGQLWQRLMKLGILEF